MSITSDMIRGHIDSIILAHLTEEDSYGYQINKHVREKTGNQYEIKEATLYSAFRRLEESSLISSYWGNEEVGARRRYYAITALGKAVLDKNRRDWQDAKGIIDKLIIGGNENV